MLRQGEIYGQENDFNFIYNVQMVNNRILWKLVHDSKSEELFNHASEYSKKLHAHALRVF